MRHRFTIALVTTLVLPGVSSIAEDRGLPLPEAPVRLVIPDADAFDAALGGGFGRAVRGEVDGSDPLVSAWRQSRVGSKLEAQWEKLAADLPWTWKEIRRLQPRSVGVALLQVGSLEALVVIDTPLAKLPLTPPAGTDKEHGGASYTLVATGAGDHGAASSRRLGLAWARSHGLLLIATSERALRLGLDEQAAGRGVEAFLPGLASLELDLDALRQDRYFRREFPHRPGPETGRIRAALRLEDTQVVEIREGIGETAHGGFIFEARDAVAAGWEPEADGLWPALRAGVLEPVPRLLPRPVPPRRPLPATTSGPASRYLVDFTRPPAEDGPWDEGDVAEWRQLLSTRPSGGWAWRVGPEGQRALALEWPEERHEELERLCRATLERRAGPVATTTEDAARVMRVGPGLPALALRRDGDFVWIATSVDALVGATALRPTRDLVRWGRVDLVAVREQGGAWARAEGPAAPERVRPFSDRILGLLGWMPEVRSLSVERRLTGDGWSERVVFGSR